MKKQSILRVIFKTKAGPKQSQFYVGKDIASLIGLNSRDKISLVIRDARSGRLLYGAAKKMTSGYEVFGLSKYLRPNQLITVEASNPRL